MPNEIRLRANNISGTITDNPLLIGATTINSPGFVDLPTVNTTNHLILILDPLEVNGAAEIVFVTAHAAASSVVTVIRGFETSTPRQHPLGTTWFHGPVASDFIGPQQFVPSTNRPPAPPAGQLIYETDTNRWTVWNGSAWLPAPHNVPACRVFHNVSQSAAHNTTTILTFNSERYDTDSMHSTSVNPSRITFNTAGLYLITATFGFASATDFDYVNGGILINNTLFISFASYAETSVNHPPRVNPTTVYKFATGEFVEAVVFQFNGAGASRNILGSDTAGNFSPEFSATWIGVG